MIKKKKDRVFAFIDSQNLNVTTQKQGWKMDWKKFRKHLEQKYGVSKAFMFIGYIPEQESMYKQMHDAGYAVVLKPTFDMTRPQGEVPEEERHIKGNVDADLVLWAMKEISNYDKAVIVTGDGDFYTLIEYLEQKKRLLKLLAPSQHYSNLYNKYENFVDIIDDSRKKLAYHSRRTK